MAADGAHVFFGGRPLTMKGKRMADSAKTTRLEMWLLLKTTSMKSDKSQSDCSQTRTAPVRWNLNLWTRILSLHGHRRRARANISRQRKTFISQQRKSTGTVKNSESAWYTTFGMLFLM